MKSPLVIIVVLVVGMAAVASIAHNYTRETTSSEFKYSKSAQEIDATYYQPLALVTPDANYHLNAFSDTPENACRDANADPDLDRLINSLEEALGTQCDNPDTDGDGIIDSVDSVPVDPTLGQSIEIWGGWGPAAAPVYRLVIDNFLKNVLNQTLGETDWTHHTTARIGDQVRFHIYASLTSNHPTDALPCVITDQLGKSLRYVPDSEGTRNYYYVNGIHNPLPDSAWLTNGLNLNIYPPTPSYPSTIVEIYFEAVVWQDPTNALSLTTNYAKIKTETQMQTDFSFITIKPVTS
ncbi:MAG: hypothetical protein WC805_02370 [Patescibacteria group bacterium]|jgi:uncharacterized repeat protein (TIGR01451 family)